MTGRENMKKETESQLIGAQNDNMTLIMIFRRRGIV